MANIKEFWKGTNFWVALLLLVLGLSTAAISPQLAVNVVMGVSGTIAAVFALREAVKGSKVDFKAWISSKNTWNYLATVVVSIVPVIPSELFTRLHELATAIIAANWQGIVTAVFSLATMLYYIVRKPVTPAAQ